MQEHSPVTGGGSGIPGVCMHVSFIYIRCLGGVSFKKSVWSGWVMLVACVVGDVCACVSCICFCLGCVCVSFKNIAIESFICVVQWVGTMGDSCMW